MNVLRNILGRRIVALMVLASAILSLLAAGVQLYFGYRSDLKRVLKEISTVETSFLDSVENALWQFNFEQVEVLIDGIYAQNNIVAVTLVAATGQRFSRGDPSARNSVERGFDLFHRRPNEKAANVGRLSIVLSLEGVRARLWSQFLTLVASNFLKTLAASIVMLFIFDRKVSRHLRRITGFASREDWDRRENDLVLERKSFPQTDELQSIVDALNSSRKRLQTSRKAAESLQARLEAVLNAATSGIVGFDEEHRIVTINPRAQHMLGVLAAELPCPWPETIAFVDSENMAALNEANSPISRLFDGHTLKSETAIMTRAAEGGEPRYVRMSSATVTDNVVSNLRFVMVIDDVSEQEKNRQQVERASRLDALGQLTGGVAHDFNNLLATISYSMELALKSETADKRARYIRSAMASVDRGASLTKRLLAFAKRQPGVAEARRLSDVLSEFETLVRPTIEEAIDLVIEPPEEDMLVFCDIAQMENALLNLVINARDAIMRERQGRKILIKARGLSEIGEDDVLRREGAHTHIAKGVERSTDTAGRTSRFVEVSVSDDGPGMDEEVRRRSLDPFFTTKETNSGTGLGLSMVYGFVQQSDGQLRIYSEEGRGTTIRLILPRGQEGGGREAPVERAAQPSGGGQTVLLVEDEQRLAELMGDVIGTFGYRVIHASRGHDAVDILRSDRVVDCLLTDVVMPGGMDGFELAAAAREIRPELPIIYMSGYTGFSKAQMGAVVAPIFAKPSPPDELALALKSAISPGTGVKR